MRQSCWLMLVAVRAHRVLSASMAATVKIRAAPGARPVNVAGGNGGPAGVGGKAGQGGKSKGCLVYRADGGRSGKAGADGLPGPVGAAGAVTVQRL